MVDNKPIESEADAGAGVQDISHREASQDPDQEALRGEAHRLGVEAVARALDQPA